ncbi:MAG: helicase-related protein [Candidatus Odinarchaeota archaeon]
MDLEELQAGIIIEGKRWKEPVEIKKIERLGNYIHIVGSSINSNFPVDQLIPEGEFTSISIQKIETDFTSSSAKVFLAFEARRYRYASLYDPLLAINISKVDPLPHQIEAVYGHILRLPRIRFLIADDPGAGKTIMAGLVIKELKLRNLVKRIIIIVPGHLKDQWRRELKERFEERFVVVDRGLLDSHFGENVWEKENQIISSIDFAKREEIVPSISSTRFDLAIMDEAHKMSAYMYGESASKTGRYKLGEILSRNSEHLLFLTATPHKGDPENFRLFLDLLEPGFFATTDMLQDSIRNKDNPLFIRRVKEDLKDFEGKPIFLPRHIRTVKFRLSDREKLLYNSVSDYVIKQYNKALSKDKRRNIAFALVILQRRLASSTAALLKSLERRKARLDELVEQAEGRFSGDARSIDIDDAEDMSEEERWREEEIWETLSVAENREELKKEIKVLVSLISQAKEIVRSDDEVKLQQLKDTLVELAREHSGEKVIIFTESRDTLEYLEKKIIMWGYSVNTIHGGLRLEQRIEAERIFKNKTQVLVATEAAGEGINLQFCNLMFNYDIPWNPNRLEQRMGRIHRYGQQREVFVFNLVATDTREGAVLSRIFDKMDEIRRSLGTDKVFDVIGDVFYGRNLQQLIIEAAANARNREEILREIEITVDEAYIARIKENLGESLATRFIDYTKIREMAEKAKEYKIVPEYSEAFFVKAFALVEGKYRTRKDGLLAIESIPYELRNIAEEDEFRRKFGPLMRSYPKTTFDKDIAFKNPDAELLSFGHPLFEAVLEYIDRSFNNDLKAGAVFGDPEGNLDGYILFYEGEIKDGSNSVAGKRLTAVYTGQEKTKIIQPTILWDLIEEEGERETVDMKELQEKVFSLVLAEMEGYIQEKQEDREREARIKEKYGIKSLDYLIVRLDGDLIELQGRKEREEKVDLAIRNKEEQKKRYIQALNELKEQIIREKTLTMEMPKFLGIIRIIPAKKVEESIQDSMKSSEEIEKIGMEESMEYERKNGRIPVDVASENLGFDIKSSDSKGKMRYIEVKARAATGSVILTRNEWFKAKRFGADYFLYVVLNAAAQPELLIVQNPAEELQPEEKAEIVRYLVPLKQITEKGMKNGQAFY